MSLLSVSVSAKISQHLMSKFERMLNNTWFSVEAQIRIRDGKLELIIHRVHN